ncbi:hypothetical protein C8R44DRAFT_887736 [Mycena epipterygia]|nr:hypothetical protein C8R44DRAFT_887736 [Mycena epipterygia]
MTRATAILALTLLSRCLGAAATYYPFIECSDTTLFDEFDFYDAIDNTTWDASHYPLFLSLAFINPNENAIIKVDNSSTVLSAGIQYRKSVLLTSKAQFYVRTLFVIDAKHMPYGCSPPYSSPCPLLEGKVRERETSGSTAPSRPAKSEPAAAEIDLIEAINLTDHNQMALHSYAGCVQPANNPTSYESMESRNLLDVRRLAWARLFKYILGGYTGGESDCSGGADAGVKPGSVVNPDSVANPAPSRLCDHAAHQQPTTPLHRTSGPARHAL